jgi:hypothetical protein
MVGKKMKNGKEVPNCVPVKEETDTLEKSEMAQTQLHFIKYAAEEILEYINMGGKIEEWYQNKLSKVQSEVESLHSYVEGESRRTGMKEEVEQIEEVKLTDGIEVKKEYDDKKEAEHGVYHNGKKIGYVVHHKPSGTHTAYHSPRDDDDYGQIDDFHSHHHAVNQIRHSAGVGIKEEVEKIAFQNVSHFLSTYLK